MENTIYTAYQDLQQYSNDDINLMAQYLDILYTSNVNDLRWLLAIKNTSRRAVMPNDLPDAAYIETLPQELILQIFENLDMADILNACQTNVLWSNICKDRVLWKKLYEKDFPNAEKVKDYYDGYIQQFKKATDLEARFKALGEKDKSLSDWEKFKRVYWENQLPKQLSAEFRQFREKKRLKK